ncbi:MAG: histone [Nanoarchaeota archaeon]
MISLNAMEKILKKHGAKRVSEDAKVTLKDLLEEYAKTISKRSILLAKHANRYTVRREDVLLGK